MRTPVGLSSGSIITNPEFLRTGKIG